MISPFLSRFLHDGANDYRTYGDPASIRFQIGDAWTLITEYASQGAAGKAIYSKQDAGFGIVVRHSATTPGALEVTIAGSTGAITVRTTATEFANGAARKLAVSYSGNSLASGIVIVIDGVAEAMTVVTDLFGGTLDANYPAAIGALNNAAVFSERYAGTLADLFFLEGAASAAKMIAYHGAPTGTRPATVLDLKEVFWAAPGAMVGTSEPDLIGGANGTLVGLTGADLEPNDVFNRKSCTFDGVNEQITYGDVLDRNIGTDTESLSLAGWFKIDGIPAAPSTIVGKHHPSGAAWGWSLSALNASGIMSANFTSDASEGQQISGVGNVCDNTWRLASVVVDAVAKTGQIYIDGATSGGAQGYAFTGSTSNAGAFTVGDKRAGILSPMDGLLGAVMMFDIALSAAQQTELYNGGKVIDPHTLSFAGNLVFYANFEDPDDETGVNDKSPNGLAGTPANMTASNFVTDVP